MCGIAGWLGTLRNGEHFAEQICKRLHHRGPDGKGVQSWAHATLIHTRLSIIDLSQAGAQPLANETGTVWTVFNGEIYNHREIRDRLEARGHIFKGHSDTEILPHLYEEEGWEFVKKIRGMFAIAVYDAQTQTLVLARDRFGIKPLFYACNKDRLAFASELQALLTLPGIDTEPDRQAIFDFAALSYIPAPETFYKGIRALQPGEVLVAQRVREGIKYRIETYHQWEITPNFSLTLSEATDYADEILTTAVGQQMESDVPLATLLSGGIDSSLVSFAAQKALGGGLKTFNVRFQESQYDETWAAVAMANFIHSHHRTLDILDGQGTWEHITGLLLHAGQPFADTSYFAVNAVCQLLQKHVTVALSGDGGDEAFGGYKTYSTLAKITRWQVAPTFLLRGGARVFQLLQNLGGNVGRWSNHLGNLGVADDTAIIQYLSSWVREKEHKALCRDSHLLQIRRLFEPQWEHHLPKGASRLERLSAQATEIGGRLRLPNDYLFKVDAASMRESLEVRVPLLDEDLFAFGLTLPHGLKVEGENCKKVLREISKRHLPWEVANKPKMGFGIPVDQWVDHDFKIRLREVLLDSSSSLQEFFQPEVYSPIVKAFCDDRALPNTSREGLYQRVIMLLAVHEATENVSNSQSAIPREG